MLRSICQPKATREVCVRWLIRRDLEDVLEIERSSFEHYWTEEDFLCCLKQRNCIGMVAETADDDRLIVGYMVYELNKGELHLLNFAVHPQWRRQGVGAAMVRKLVDKLAQTRRREIRVEVRDGNLPAQLFFRHQGFVATNVLRGYYEDTTEDAYVMALTRRDYTDFDRTIDEDFA